MSIASDAVAATGLARKEHGVTTIIISHSFGTINGVVTHEEDAITPEELAYKHELITDGVLMGLWGANNGQGGTVRRMKEEFIDAMEAAGGDLAKAMEESPWKKGKDKDKDKGKPKR